MTTLPEGVPTVNVLPVVEAVGGRTTGAVVVVVVAVMDGNVPVVLTVDEFPFVNIIKRTTIPMIKTATMTVIRNFLFIIFILL